jgi:hypothetical protein
VSAAAARPRAIAGAVGPTPTGARARDGSALGAREATLRSGGTACLAGIALLLAVELPPALARSTALGVLLLGAMATCVGAGLALVAAPASASPRAWGAAAAAAAAVLAGWALPRAVSLPEPAGARGGWVAMPGVACAGLAAACLVLAAAAVPPARRTARGLAAALAVLAAWAPGVVAFLVATGPGTPGGEAAIPASGHVHAPSVAPEPVIVVRPGPTGNHYVTPVSTTPRPPAPAVVLLAAGAAVFVAGAAASLRRRSTAAPRHVPRA